MQGFTGGEKVQKFRKVLHVLTVIVTVLAGCGNRTSLPEQPAITPEPAITAESSPVTTEPVTEPAPGSPATVNPLTGREVQQVIPLLAVMIENTAAGRPQTGLQAADVVYEIEVEGMLTRLMALFYGDPPANAGPVRSARPYFMELARGWGAHYAHVGGSDQAYAMVSKWKISDMDDTRGSPGFWVDPQRKRPYSTYLKLEKALAGKKDLTQLPQWTFQTSSLEVVEVSEISVKYHNNLVKYLFDQVSNAFRRSINGKDHLDRDTGKPIQVTNVIIQYANHRNLNDKLGHIQVAVTGKGRADFFLAGRYLTGTWEKSNLEAQTVFRDNLGNPVQMAPGNTWIQVVRPNLEVRWLPPKR